MSRVHGCEVTAYHGDITAESTEAIVNAANPTLLGGGGVDGAIHARAGPTLLEECREIRRSAWPKGLPAGEAVITSGGRLAAAYVIHTVGPVWQGGGHGEAEALRKAYTSCLRLARSLGIGSIAFPSISTGAYGYPFREASHVAVDAVVDFLESDRTLEAPPAGRALREVRFVLFTSAALSEFREVLQRRLAP